DKDSSESIIATRIIEVTPGINEYTLDLFIPYTGENFGIQVTAFGEGATAYRHFTAGTVSLPYEIEGVVSITSSNQVDQTAAYYFLYNWQVSAAGCATDERQGVTISPNEAATAILSGGGQTNPTTPEVSLSVELTGTAPWSITYTRDGGNSTVIEDIGTSPHTFNVSEPGSYALATVTDANGCENGTVSGTAEVTAGVVTSLAEGSSQGFTVYPNPSSKQVAVKMPSKLFGQKVMVRIMSSTGIIVGTHQTIDASLSLDVSKLPKGMYLLLMAVGEEEYQERLIVN
ncbi:MAG: T9SS type A sorting domain-containing protein, partial [Bacteroidota bacterium]